MVASMHVNFIEIDEVHVMPYYKMPTMALSGVDSAADAMVILLSVLRSASSGNDVSHIVPELLQVASCNLRLAFGRLCVVNLYAACLTL